MTVDYEFVLDAFDASGGDSIKSDLLAVVELDWAGHGRSAQKAIGPSEAGSECARQLAAKMVDAPRTNPQGDSLPAWLGTAGHSALELAFIAENERLMFNQQAPRWITERRLQIADGLAGTADLYDVRDGRVTDFKFPGASMFSKYRKGGPSEVYRVQGHLYGLGYANAGFDVREVSIWFIPRSSSFEKSFVWSEPFDRDLALAAVDRLAKIRTAVDLIGAVEDNSQLDRVPAKPGDACRFCPFSGKSAENVWACSQTP
jgi:hypothetical protein